MTMVRQRKAVTEKKTPPIEASYREVQSAIGELQLEELVTLKSDVELQIKQKQKEQKKELRAKMLEIAKVAGFKSVEEFVASQKGRNPRSDKGVKMPPKYRNPQDAKKTWSGQGRKPNWVLEYLEKGGKLEKLKIS